MTTFNHEPHAAGASDLHAIAQDWLANLDDSVRPVLLPKHYPRVVNRMAVLWQDPKRMREYFDEIMVNTRGSRQGFPDEVVVELSTLKHHYNRSVFPLKVDVWEKVWSNLR